MEPSIASVFEGDGDARRVSLDTGNTISHMPSSSSGSNNISPADRILTSPNYSYVFGFEKDFDHVEVKEV